MKRYEKIWRLATYSTNLEKYLYFGQEWSFPEAEKMRQYLEKDGRSKVFIIDTIEDEVVDEEAANLDDVSYLSWLTVARKKELRAFLKTCPASDRIGNVYGDSPHDAVRLFVNEYAYHRKLEISLPEALEIVKKKASIGRKRFFGLF